MRGAPSNLSGQSFTAGPIAFRCTALGTSGRLSGMRGPYAWASTLPSSGTFAVSGAGGCRKLRFCMASGMSTT